MSEPFFYTFPAIRGIQAGMEYYISMCPLRLIPKIFVFNEEELDVELRAQRVLNKARIPEICTYIIENPDSYVFSALTASIDGDIEFTPVTPSPSHYNMGSLKVPMTAKFVINDGQHRRAAIDAALKKSSHIGDETISIVFYIDLGLKRSQQMFSDLNRYAIRPTKSLNILYDNRDPFSLMVKEIAEKVPVFKGNVEMEKSTISNRSTELFTLSGLYHGTAELLKDRQILSLKKQEGLAIDFWTCVCENIKEWQMASRKEIQASQLRKDYVNAHSIAIVALGIAGNNLINEYPDDWKTRLKYLQKINWHRENRDVWEGKVIIGGRISGSRNSLAVVSDYIKQVLELNVN
jgi:DNA sulfur modification protein DndB